jgi:hypothetical protein
MGHETNQFPKGNPLLDYFFKSEHQMHKWVHYFEVYDRFFHNFRHKKIKFLEIGVDNGGSTRMWKDYFGPNAEIIGVDINPDCKSLETENIEIWIGDQSDQSFWESLLKVHPEFDIILDDGGHTMDQQIITFEALFPSIKNGGLYLCEDVHTSYFPSHGGGIRRSNTFITWMKDLVDEMHSWYHRPVGEVFKNNQRFQEILSVCFFDSVVVVEKRNKKPPMSLAPGQELVDQRLRAMSFLEMRRLCGVSDN